MNNKIYKVRVPATSANFGSGFDTLGAAFNIYNTFYFQELKTNELIIEGVKPEFQNESNLVYQSALEIFKRLNYFPIGLKICESNEVPFGKGLGSSATCIIGGLCGANALCGSPLTKAQMLTIASEIEGHPDNVAPALFGNLTASMMVKGQTITFVNEINSEFSFYACIPDFELSTKYAKEILPKKYPIQDVVYNISHSIATFEALKSGNSEVLKLSLGDKIHESYRYNLIDGSEALTSFISKNDYLGCYLSGAGPTIIVICNKYNRRGFKNLKNFCKNNLTNWNVIELRPDNLGCLITEI